MVEERYLGAFTWEGEVIGYMMARLKAFPTLYKLAKSKRVFNNMHREYMSLIAEGFTQADIISGKGDFLKWNAQTYRMASLISDRVNVPKLLVINFFNALYNLALQGKIPYQKWNPKGFQEAKDLQKTLPSEKSIFTKSGEVVGKFGKNLIPIAIVAGVLGGYFLFKKS